MARETRMASTACVWAARSCTTGTEVENGDYTGAPAQRTTTVSAGDLSEGANTIRVCVTDAAGNQGSQTTSVAKDTAQSTTLTFGPQADARVEEANPDTNFGTSSSLRVEGGSALDMESYLRFQVTGVLGTVEQAKLRLWVTNGTPNGPAAYSTDWAGAETAITWNNRAPRTSGPTDDKGRNPGGRIRGVRRDAARDRQRDGWPSCWPRTSSDALDRLLPGIQHRLTEAAADRDLRRRGRRSRAAHRADGTHRRGRMAHAGGPELDGGNRQRRRHRVRDLPRRRTADHGGRRDATTRT